MLVTLMGSFRPQIKTSEPKYPRLWEGLGWKLAQSSKAIYEHETHRQRTNDLRRPDPLGCSSRILSQLEAFFPTYCSLIPQLILLIDRILLKLLQQNRMGPRSA